MYVLDSIVIANGDVGISGSRSSPCKNKTFLHAKKGGPRDSSRFYTVHVVNNFKIQNSIATLRRFSVEATVMLTDLTEARPLIRTECAENS
jgi:hypothetical protein